ncbi:hypothetical protein C8J27_103263 [Rhodobacter aestuarii]|uniref:Uncharacterized protein n=1 Tax=Rhodobacter aestuarii TaxID=453582 RepID=A0A1N7JYL4_9RHOB|nr:hypothetical protein [Rhodobacter aestuarii]PTV95933.1 hypothetical protein C8J27_103263 [Rhodobacter aestuarii]SIS54410.1 hypothetical protein SAMN05421580_102171 [Rhodobacter aestuarii]
MPAPDPFGIAPSLANPISVWVDTWPNGNVKHRKARAVRIVRKIASPLGWTCPACGDPVPFTRRADAIYCREACRKRAKRARASGEPI